MPSQHMIGVHNTRHKFMAHE